MENRELASRRGTTAVGALLPTPGPRAYTALIWWVFGLYALFMAKAPFTPSFEAEAEYDELMSRAMFSEEGMQAERQYRRALQELDQVNVFFWQWREPYSRLVPRKKEQVAAARAEFEALSAERDALISDAKATVGIWSQHGVDEVRSRFWADYQWGKDLAKRMTWWDFLLGTGGGRDEEAYVTLLRWVGQIMLNFTVGLCSALFMFIFTLLGLIWEYKTSLLSGTIFFVVALTGASSMVALFVGGMYATAVGGVYLAAQSHAARLEGRGAAPRQRVRHQQHYRTE
eukprot:CAMPEP_0183337490 /NCGR_PEP_ID=MMETSP0164_2-20130417/5110_1 /TAXON_ID=221442 /ORGANISM="Coccolithus pelagicus ssp braarudi, Strain PLY182g" /LENGTH=285 /DNA_ID=CAMNT_0025507183 /DNA_START=25 /DNA_END=882 /DNA_ORIENTATION=-